MDNLKVNYKHIKFLVETDSWPPVHFKNYANLAYIEVSDAQKLRKQPNKPAISKIVNTKKLIDEIFASTAESHIPNRILIEGNPGIGKTTLAKEICYQWAMGNLLESDKLVLLMFARDPRVQNITCLAELIQYFFLPIPKFDKIVEELKITKYQNRMTIIIDGFDELSLILQQKSFLRDIIERKVLENAKIIITSRPFASTTLHHYVDKRIEILGFDVNSRQDYICANLKDAPDSLEKLQRHFQMHPNIDALCYNPLCLTIIVFMSLLGSLPSTATEMYGSFVVHSIYRHLKRCEISLDISVNSVKDFPSDVFQTLCELGKVAYLGLMEDKIVFTLADLPAFCKDDPSCYGLLCFTEFYTAKETHHPTLSFNFLHLEIQEYLAAMYVASLPYDDTISLLESSFLPQDEELLLPDDFSVSIFRSNHIRFANMWIYYFGIVGTSNPPIVYFLSSYSSSNLKESKSFVMESEFNPVAKNVFKNPVNALYLFQCCQEAQDNEKCMLFSTHFDNSIILTGYHYELQPYQITSLGFFLSKSKREWEELNLYNCNIRDHGVNILHNYLTCSEVLIKKLNLCSNNLTAASSSCIGNLIIGVKANYVLLSYNVVNMADIANVVCRNDFLKELWLMETGITKHDAKSLADLIDIGLVELYISRNQLGDEGAEILSHAVCKSTKLKVLDISSNGIKAEGAKAIALALQNTKSLNILWIGNNHIGHEGAEVIANAMSHSVTLKELLLNGDKTIDTESAQLLLNRAIENYNIILLSLPSLLSNQDQDMLKTDLRKMNSVRSRNYTPLIIDFL